MTGQQHKRLNHLWVVAASGLVLVVAALTWVDVSGDAESSSAEKWCSSDLLDAKIRAILPRKLSPLTQADEDLERAVDLYQQQCVFCHGGARGRMAPFAK